MDYRMRRSTLRMLCILLNAMVFIPFALIVIADTSMTISSKIHGWTYESLVMAVHPLFYLGVLLLLITPAANFFFAYYEKKKNFLLQALNIILSFFFFMAFAGFLNEMLKNDSKPDWMLLNVLMLFLTFGFSYLYISDAKRFWLNSAE